MKSLEISRRIHSIDALIKSTQGFTHNDFELQSHWAKYLCVVASGFLEKALVNIYTDFCNQASSDRVATYAASRLRMVQNPKASTFVEVASSFDKDWGTALQAYLDEDGRRQAIDSIVTNRHMIAHGNPSDITLARLKEYFAKAVDVLEYLETLCTGGR